MGESVSQIRSLLNRLNRARKTKVRGPKKHAHKSQTQAIDNKQVIRGIRITAVIVVVLAVLFGGWIVFKVLGGAELSPSVMASAKPSVPLSGDQTNILLVGYDSNDSYSFVDFLAVLSLSRSENKQRLVIIDPNFTSAVINNKNVKFRNLLNNALINNLPPLDTLQRAVEVTIGMNIDRYITADISLLPNALHGLGLSYVTPDGLVDSDAGEFRTNQTVTDKSLVNYLAADEPGQNEQMQRLGKFFKSELESNSNVWRTLSLIINPDPWTKLINTNSTKLELLNWTLSMMNNTSVQYTYIGTSEGVFHPDLTGGYYTPSTIQIDQKIQTSFDRSNVTKEQARIEVYNATITSGLATVTKRLLVNQGATVIRTGNYSDQQDRSKLYVLHPENFVNTVAFISEQLRGNLIVVNQDYPFNHTGDMVLVLGADALD